jgi:MOB kinase activator 1
VYAIVYSHHFLVLERIGAAPHLNTSFKHFMFFVWEYGLVEDKELAALSDIIRKVRAMFDALRYEA